MHVQDSPEARLRFLSSHPRFAANTSKPPPNNEVLQDLFQKIPKTELHMHLSGSTPIELIRTFLREQGWEEGQIREQTRLKNRYKDLDDFLESYYKVAYHVKTAEQFRRATEAIVKEAARENVRYLEIRSSILSKGEETPEEIVGAIEAGLRQGEAWVKNNLGFEMKTGLIVLAQRAGSPEKSLQSAQLAVELAKRPGSKIVGFDLAGSEANHAVTRHKEALRYVKQHGLPLTVHAGETSHSKSMTGADSIRNALKLGADRIGHGLQAVTDKKLLAKLIRDQTPLEVCPESNIQISEVPSYAAHPLPKLAEAGANVSLNADNRMITPINLSDQLGILHREGLLSCWEQLKTLSLNGIRGAFLPPFEKKQLERQFKAEFGKLEQAFRQTIEQAFCQRCDHPASATQPRRQA